jgi:hypothetical protein
VMLYEMALNEPTDWGKTAAAGLETGLAGGYYGLAFRSTTAPSQKAQATGVEIFRLFFLTEGVADNGSLSQDFGAKDFVMALDAFSNEGLYGDALVAAFLDPAAASQGVKADIGNRVSALIRSV